MQNPIHSHPLRAWRERQGISQGDFAESLGVTQGAISHIEVGRCAPSSDLALLIEEQTGIAIKDLLCWFKANRAA